MAALPRARTDGELAIEELGDELVIYDERTHQAHCLTAFAAAVFRRCDGRQTIPALAAALGAEETLVRQTVEELDERGLLDAAPAPAGYSRREVTRRLAQVGGAALGAPLIYSVAMPHASAAASVGAQPGSPGNGPASPHTCTQPSNGISNYCDQTTGTVKPTLAAGATCVPGTLSCYGEQFTVTAGTFYQPRTSDYTYCDSTTKVCVPHGIGTRDGTTEDALTAQGGSCTSSAQCGTGFCVDGVCCNSSCSGQCQACDVVGHVGTCAPVTGWPHGNRIQCGSGGACEGLTILTCVYTGH